MNFKKVRDLAMENYWISGRAAIYDGDPFSAIENPLTENSFGVMPTIAELHETFLHGNWAIRCAFAYKNLAFINQVDGGDEWLVIKEFDDDLIAFESVSFGRMTDADGFEAYMARLLKATKEQCRHVTY